LPFDIPGAEAWLASDGRLAQPVRVLVLGALAPNTARRATAAARLVTDRRFARIIFTGDERHADVTHSPYVVTEHVPGIALVDALRMNLLAPDAAAAVVGEAARALGVAARQGQFHSQLRASAIRLRPNGAVAISGLGIDRVLASQAALGGARGEKADAVALASLLVEVLTGYSARDARLEDLPDDLVGSARALAEAAIKGKAPATIAEVVSALRPWNTTVLRETVQELDRTTAVAMPADVAIPAPVAPVDSPVLAATEAVVAVPAIPEPSGLAQELDPFEDTLPLAPITAPLRVEAAPASAAPAVVVPVPPAAEDDDWGVDALLAHPTLPRRRGNSRAMIALMLGVLIAAGVIAWVLITTPFDKANEGGPAPANQYPDFDPVPLDPVVTPLPSPSPSHSPDN